MLPGKIPDLGQQAKIETVPTKSGHMAGMKFNMSLMKLDKEENLCN